MFKTKKILLLALLLGILLTVSGAGCFLIAPSTSPGLDTVQQAWNILLQDYVDRSKLDPTALSQGAIKGMVEALHDPYTAYIDPETLKLSLSDFEGKFEGIGAQVATRDSQIIIIAPISGSPADRAGIRPGDAILEINGESTTGMSLTEAVVKIRGPTGTAVSLLVLHQGETAPVKIDIVRAEIKTESVFFEMKGDTAYIRISHFSEPTYEEMAPVMTRTTSDAATGIVLDLRSNPGGILQTVVDVAGYFLKEGVVVDVIDNEGRRTTTSVKPGGVTTDLPMVVLVDSYSASGSEVLAGALQDYGRATIAGTKTFGKGSVNILRQLNDGSGLYVTTARWLTPKGRLIEGLGLQPDIELKLTGDEAIAWAIDYLKGKR